MSRDHAPWTTERGDIIDRRLKDPRSLVSAICHLLGLECIVLERLVSFEVLAAFASTSVPLDTSEGLHALEALRRFSLVPKYRIEITHEPC